MPNPNVAFATVKFKPRPADSQFRSQLDTIVSRDGNDHKIYFDVGQLTDYLQKGDTLCIEYKSGKWRPCKTQAPELMQQLKQRKHQAQPTAAPATAPKPPAIAAAGPTAGSLEDDCTQMIRIFGILRSGLPNTPDECVQAMACTIWVERNRR